MAEQQQLPWTFQVTDMDDIMESITQQGKAFNLYKLLGSSVSELYNHMLQRGWTWLWPLQMKLNKLLVRLNYQTGVTFFERYWREQQPDLVISVVTMCNRVLWDALQKAKPDTPYITLPIDFADYPPGFWFEPDTDSYAFCGTAKAMEQARHLGVKETRILPTSGMVIHPRFYQPMVCDRARERQRLGLDPHKLTAIVMFGGKGAQVMAEIARRLEPLHQTLQLIFLCGHNQSLAHQLRQLPGEQTRFITDFTEDIPRYMHLADFFIGKPGPGSLSEALAMGLPIITVCNVSTLIHERYNAEWVRTQGVGLVLTSFRQVSQAVGQLLQPGVLRGYQTRVAAIQNRAVFEVVEAIQTILSSQYQDPNQVMGRHEIYS